MKFSVLRKKGRLLRVPVDFRTIQQAVSFSSDGDTVEIMSGEYWENISISKSINIRSAHGISTVKIFPKLVAHPTLVVDHSRTSPISITGIEFAGDKRAITNVKIGIRITNGILNLIDCKFVDWNIIPDGSLPDDNDFRRIC